MKVNNSLKEAIDNYGDDHVGSSATTPLRADAFELSNSDKIDQSIMIFFSKEAFLLLSKFTYFTIRLLTTSYRILSKGR